MTRRPEHFGEPAPAGPSDPPAWLERRIDAYLDGSLSPVKEAKLLDLLSRRPSGYARLVNDRAWIDTLTEPIEAPDMTPRVLGELGRSFVPADERDDPPAPLHPGRVSWRRPAVAIAAALVLLVSLQSNPGGSLHDHAIPTQVIPIETYTRPVHIDSDSPGSSPITMYSIVADGTAAPLERDDAFESDSSRVMPAIDMAPDAERLRPPHHWLDDPLRAPFGTAELPPGLEHLSAHQPGGSL